MAGLQTKSTNGKACGDAYQSLPDFLPVLQDPLVFLVWSTILYQASDLGQGRRLTTFTNHYHRTEDITHSGLDYVLCWVIMDYDVDAMTGTCMM